MALGWAHYRMGCCQSESMAHVHAAPARVTTKGISAKLVPHTRRVSALTMMPSSRSTTTRKLPASVTFSMCQILPLHTSCSMNAQVEPSGGHALLGWRTSCLRLVRCMSNSSA